MPPRNTKVTLRPCSPDDAELLASWYSDPAVYGRFDEPHPTTPEQVLASMEAGEYDGEADARRIIEADGPIGYVGFTLHPWDSWVAMLSVTVALPDRRGLGLGTEAHRLAVPWIFDSAPKVQKVEAVTDAENAAERRVLEKIGFRLEGVLRARNRLRGELRDMAFYGVMRHESLRPQRPARTSSS